MSDTLDTILSNAEASIESLEERLEGTDVSEGGLEALADELTEEELEGVLEDLEELYEVLDEAEDVLDAVDLTELPEAIDASELLEAIEVGEIPDALANEDEDLGDAVSLRGLFHAIKLKELWDAASVRELWQSKRELDDAIDDVTDEDDEDSMLEDAVDTVTGDDDDDEDSMLEDAADVVTGDDEGGLTDDVFEGETDFGVGDGDGSFGPEDGDLEEYQVIIQQQAFEGIDEFRTALLETHAKFQQLYEYNRERMRRQDTSTNSRNPTAVSTISTTRGDMGGPELYSTVPRATKYSTAPNRKRIYGSRFERELEKRRGERDE